MKKKFMSIFVLFVAIVSAASSAHAQSPACGAYVQQVLRGTWSLTCTGFTDLSRVNPNVPPNTLVPFASLGNTTISADGIGAGKSIFSIGGTMLPVKLEGIFTVNPDCTGELSYEITSEGPDPAIQGTASVVYVPRDLEFRTMILAPGEVITCQYKKMYNAPSPN